MLLQDGETFKLKSLFTVRMSTCKIIGFNF